MSTLTPLSFPEYTEGSDHSLNQFPYPAIDANKNYAAQSPDHSTNRMQQLEAMLKEVQGRAEIVEKETYDQAYLAGEKAGMALGKKRGEQTLATLQASLQCSGDLLQKMQQLFAEAAMDVAGFIAKQIVTETLATDTTKLWEIAKQAAAQLPDTKHLGIAVSQDDYVTFKRLLEDEDSMAVLSSDASIANGTCRIISSQQDILVDPVAAIDVWLKQLQPDMLKAANQEIPSEQFDGNDQCDEHEQRGGNEHPPVE